MTAVGKFSGTFYICSGKRKIKLQDWLIDAAYNSWPTDSSKPTSMMWYGKMDERTEQYKCSMVIAQEIGVIVLIG